MTNPEALDPERALATQARKILEETQVYMDLLQAQPNPGSYREITQALAARLPQSMMLYVETERLLVQWADCVWCDEQRGPSVGGQFMVDVGEGLVLPMCKECHKDPLVDIDSYNRDFAIARLLRWWATSQAENKRMAHLMALDRERR